MFRKIAISALGAAMLQTASVPALAMARGNGLPVVKTESVQLINHQTTLQNPIRKKRGRNFRGRNFRGGGFRGRGFGGEEFRVPDFRSEEFRVPDFRRGEFRVRDFRGGGFRGRGFGGEEFRVRDFHFRLGCGPGDRQQPSAQCPLQ